MMCKKNLIQYHCKLATTKTKTKTTTNSTWFVLFQIILLLQLSIFSSAHGEEQHAPGHFSTIATTTSTSLRRTITTTFIPNPSNIQMLGCVSSFTMKACMNSKNHLDIPRFHVVPSLLSFNYHQHQHHYYQTKQRSRYITQFFMTSQPQQEKEDDSGGAAAAAAGVVVGSRSKMEVVTSTNNNNYNNNDPEYVFLEEDDVSVSDELWEDINDSKPPVWMVMKQLLGINIFTYILAALIVITLSLNTILGPGWLGQQLGLEGTGTFTEMSDSLPNVLDLDGVENLL